MPPTKAEVLTLKDGGWVRFMHARDSSVMTDALESISDIGCGGMMVVEVVMIDVARTAAGQDSVTAATERQLAQDAAKHAANRSCDALRTVPNAGNSDPPTKVTTASSYSGQRVDISCSCSVLRASVALE